jgi:DNA-binding HxlR family transcriptional regulator
MKEEPIKISVRCPIRTTLEMLGGKWRLLILFQLSQQAWRPADLRRRIPDISEKMLIQELKHLADSGLVLRTNYGEVPPKVEYELTDLGRLALPLIEQMRTFALAYEAGMVVEKVKI